jgi:hypothetical protein
MTYDQFAHQYLSSIGGIVAITVLVCGALRSYWVKWSHTYKYLCVMPFEVDTAVVGLLIATAAYLSQLIPGPYPQVLLQTLYGVLMAEGVFSFLPQPVGGDAKGLPTESIVLPAGIKIPPTGG